MLRERELMIQVLADANGPVDAVSLRYGLDMLGSPVEAQHYAAHLDYLQERNYIRLEHRRMGGIKVVLVELTAMGRDVYAGIKIDPGIGQGGADVVLPHEHG
jgi:hypothetical protein